MKRLLKSVLERIAMEKLRRCCDLSVGPGAQVEYRTLCVKPPAKLTIGEKSMVQASIVAERPQAQVSIGSNTFVGRSRLICTEQIDIGNDVLISWGCTLVDHDSHSTTWAERSNDVHEWLAGRKDWRNVKCSRITVGDRAWIGFNTIVLKGVTIGEGAIVGAGSVVTRSVEPYCVVAGNPARFIKRLPDGQR